MPALVIKQLPADLHRKLKIQAKRHRRSMTQEAIVLMEAGLKAGPPLTPDIDPEELPRPITLRHPARGRIAQTGSLLRQAIRKGRT